MFLKIRLLSNHLNKIITGTNYRRPKASSLRSPESQVWEKSKEEANDKKLYFRKDDLGFDGKVKRFKNSNMKECN